MMANKKIGAIENGINLDHIPQGNAWYIIKLLKLERKYPVGIGLNLLSKRMGVKDLVKVENYFLTDKQLKAVSVFAPGATYSEIRNFEVVRKIQLTLPESIDELIICPNHRCISHQYRSLFRLSYSNENAIAQCHYCEHHFNLSDLNAFQL